MQEQSEYNLLVSWSGERSKAIAEILHGWLSVVVQSCRPFMSDLDLDVGQRWQLEIARHLETLRVGVFVVTPENQHKPWVNFEAGAISKKLSDPGVMTLLVGFADRGDHTGPLTQFQNSLFCKDEVKRLVLSINHGLGTQAVDDAVSKVFESFWHELEVKVSAVPEPVGAVVSGPRDPFEKVDEILELVRYLAADIPKTVDGIADEVGYLFEAVSRDRMILPRKTQPKALNPHQFLEWTTLSRSLAQLAVHPYDLDTVSKQLTRFMSSIGYQGVEVVEDQYGESTEGGTNE